MSTLNLMAVAVAKYLRKDVIVSEDPNRPPEEELLKSKGHRLIGTAVNSDKR